MAKWGDDLVHPAGALPWSGQPICIEPSDGEKAAALRPRQQVPAEWLNFYLRQIDYLRDTVGASPAINWGDQKQDPSDRAWDNWHARRFCVVRDGSTGFPWIVGVLDNGTVVRARANGDFETHSAGDITAPSNALFCFASRYTLKVISPLDGQMYYSNFIEGSSLSLDVDLSGYSNLQCGAYYEAIDRWFIGGSNDILVSDGGISYDAATKPGSLTTVGFILPELGEPESDYILACQTPETASIAKPLVSADGGDTWALTGTMAELTGTDCIISGAIRASDKSYWAVSSTGLVFRTYDPSPSGTWTKMRNLGGTARKVAVIGDCVVIAPESRGALDAEQKHRGNVWIFREGHDTGFPIVVGDGAYDWGGGIMRYDGGLLAIRAREIDTNDWRAEIALSARSVQNILEGNTGL